MNFTSRPGKVHPFIWFWLAIALLYIPAWRAGFVTDAIDWLYDARTLPFWKYLNRPHSTIHSLYQVTQLTTLGIYKLFGTARLPWHLLMISLQALNGWLLYLLFRRIFEDARLAKGSAIAFWGSLLFCISPYLSEVLVWKACFHYLQGLLLILGILRCLQLYILKPDAKWAWLGGLLFALSSFSLEIFYLTPFFSFTLIGFYHPVIRQRDGSLRPVMLRFLLPQLLIFGLHLALFHLYYGEWLSHSNSGVLAVPFYDHLVKGLQYIFHVLFFGRFWPQVLKDKIYTLCERPLIIGLGYALLVTVMGLIIVAAGKGKAKARVGNLLLLWTLASTVLVIPMPLEKLFDLSNNRYLYVTIAFSSMLLALAVSAIRWRWAVVGLTGGWILVSSFLTLRTNRHWQTSIRISESLLKNVPPANGRTMIMLSLPYCYKGVPMINAFPYSNFQRTHNMLETPPIAEKVYDAAAFNMASPNDGSEVEVVNDSTIKVTLLQWGTWWWYKDFGGYSYETPDYRLDMRDQGHWYEIILKRPMKEYLLLYQVGNSWKEVSPAIPLPPKGGE